MGRHLVGAVRVSAIELSSLYGEHLTPHRPWYREVADFLPEPLYRHTETTCLRNQIGKKVGPNFGDFKERGLGSAWERGFLPWLVVKAGAGADLASIQHQGVEEPNLPHIPLCTSGASGSRMRQKVQQGNDRS